MTTASKFGWAAGNLEPAWLRLAPLDLRNRLAQLMMAAQLGDVDRARGILLQPPWPTTREQACARIAKAVEFLLDEPS